MSISQEEVRRVSMLARLEIDEGEMLSLTRHFQEILQYFNRLQELDLEGIDPFVMEGVEGTPWREDHSARWDGRSEVLSGSPRREGDFFMVPSILGEEG